MKVVYTDEALADLDDILGYISSHYPAVYTLFERRLRTVEARIGAWPESAPEVAERPGVRVVPLIRYPYKIFYRVGLAFNLTSHPARGALVRNRARYFPVRPLKRSPTYDNAASPAVQPQHKVAALAVYGDQRPVVREGNGGCDQRARDDDGNCLLIHDR